MVDDSKEDLGLRMETAIYLSRSLPLRVVLRVPFFSGRSLSHPSIVRRCTSLFIEADVPPTQFSMEPQDTFLPLGFAKNRVHYKKIHQSIMNFFGGAPSERITIYDGDGESRALTYPAWVICERAINGEPIHSIMNRNPNLLITSLIFQKAKDASRIHCHIDIHDLWKFLPSLPHLSSLHLFSNLVEFDDAVEMPTIRLSALQSLTVNTESDLVRLDSKVFDVIGYMEAPNVLSITLHGDWRELLIRVHLILGGLDPKYLTLVLSGSSFAYDLHTSHPFEQISPVLRTGLSHLNIVFPTSYYYDKPPDDLDPPSELDDAYSDSCPDDNYSDEYHDEAPPDNDYEDYSDGGSSHEYHGEDPPEDYSEGDDQDDPGYESESDDQDDPGYESESDDQDDPGYDYQEDDPDDYYLDDNPDDYSDQHHYSPEPDDDGDQMPLLEIPDGLLSAIRLLLQPLDRRCSITLSGGAELGFIIPLVPYDIMKMDVKLTSRIFGDPGSDHEASTLPRTINRLSAGFNSRLTTQTSQWIWSAKHLCIQSQWYLQKFIADPRTQAMSAETLDIETYNAYRSFRFSEVPLFSHNRFKNLVGLRCPLDFAQYILGNFLMPRLQILTLTSPSDTALSMNCLTSLVSREEWPTKLNALVIEALPDWCDLIDFIESSFQPNASEISTVTLPGLPHPSILQVLVRVLQMEPAGDMSHLQDRIDQFDPDDYAGCFYCFRSGWPCNNKAFCRRFSTTNMVSITKDTDVRW
ncbi:hypothetical protein M408DRAFT_323969 [Serendipita vermifera MAFF 305830]|uniref:Uncharacterized protein n=1 Tax=Serendipita vermifera MAFF 305830 TaxID=933852 RepID=A0A0C2W6Y3_SERVB|nr:hypothetical protein M408DRAFT_323969 [Serendipita vermifera MAFF 305830]